MWFDRHPVRNDQQLVYVLKLYFRAQMWFYRHRVREMIKLGTSSETLL